MTYTQYPCDCGHKEVREHIYQVYSEELNKHFSLCATCHAKAEMFDQHVKNRWQFKNLEAVKKIIPNEAI
ncbi:hypothetical protein PV783_33940 [Chitinophaga sp. CC14]|uniref:hypothetical protein n=1 Tax=Chitinophaga sp. CC14 TaxID=3029199 RepID=UPI003B7797E9